MKFIYISLLFVIINLNILAQTTQNLPSAVSVANASVADSHLYSAFSNPATASIYRETVFGLQYDSRFNVKQLSHKSTFFIFPLKNINIGISATYFGYSQYNEIMTGLHFSRNFNQLFSLGIQYNYLSVYFAESNKRFASLFPQVGLLIKPLREIVIGFQIFNPMQQSIKTLYSKKNIPSVFSLGFDWHISDELRFLAQTDKNISGNYRFAGGFEYLVKDFLVVKSGAYNSEYLIPVLGFVFKLNAFDFYLNTEFHPVLGLVASASVRLRIRKN